MASEPRTQSVKLRTKVVKDARAIVALRGHKTLTDYLSDILEPILTKEKEELLAEWARLPKGRGGPKP